MAWDRKDCIIQGDCIQDVKAFVYSSKQNHHINNTLLFPISPSLPNTTAFKTTAQKNTSLSYSCSHTCR